MYDSSYDPHTASVRHRQQTVECNRLNRNKPYMGLQVDSSQKAKDVCQSWNTISLKVT